MKTLMRPLAEIKPYEKNARHNDAAPQRDRGDVTEGRRDGECIRAEGRG